MNYSLIGSKLIEMEPTQNKSLALFALRLAFGFRLIYGVIDNILSWERMLEFRDFLALNGFPIPLISAVLSVYLQFLAGLCWILGYQVKLASVFMILNFVVAIVGVHLLHGDSYINMAPAIHLLVVAFLLYVLGPGNISLKEKFKN